MSPQNTNNVILGIGYQAMSDDAAGIKVTRYIIKNYPSLEPLQIIDASVLSYQLTDVLENAQNIVVVKAAQLSQPPGTVKTLVGTDMDRFFKRPQRTANETALADMFDIVRLAQHLPPNRALITIEPKKVTWGNRLSAHVSKAIPHLAENALAMMSQWTGLRFQDQEQALEQQQQPPSTKPSSRTLHR